MTTTTTDTDTDTYYVCPHELTVYRRAPGGEIFDLNAAGEPCATLEDVAHLIRVLWEQGFYGPDVHDVLLDALPLPPEGCEVCGSPDGPCGWDCSDSIDSAYEGCSR